MKNIMISMFMCLTTAVFSSMYSDGSTFYNPANTVGGESYFIVGTNVPNDIKARADYVCDNINDEVQFQAVFDKIQAAGQGAVSLIGDFRFYAPAYLPPQITINGNGVTVTQINNQSTTSPTFVFDPSYWDDGQYGSFITFKDMYFTVSNTNPGANVSIGYAKDTFFNGVFFSGGSDPTHPKVDTSLRLFGTWGVIMDGGTLAEFASNIGIDLQTLGNIYTGTFTGLPADVKSADYPRVGDMVTQASTSATGFISWIDASDAFDVEWGDTYSSGDSTGDPVELGIVQTSSGYFSASGGVVLITGKTPTFTTATRGSANTDSGAKICNGKYMQNGGADINIGSYVSNTLITGCEFALNASACSIKLKGTTGTVITGNRWNSIGSTATAGVYIDTPIWTENTQASITNNTVRTAGKPFVIIKAGPTTDRQSGNVIKNNIIRTLSDPSAFTLFTDEGNTVGAATGNCNFNLWADNIVVDNATSKDYSGTFEAIPLLTALAPTLVVSGNIFSNSAFTGDADKTLPAAIPGKISFKIVNTHKLDLIPASGETIVWATADGGVIESTEAIESATVGSFLELRCFVTGTWVATQVVGTWAERNP